MTSGSQSNVEGIDVQRVNGKPLTPLAAPTWQAFLALAIIGTIAYLPFQFLPLISDDYTQIALGRQYGPVSEWDALARDALYRCRATSILLTYVTDRTVGVGAPVLNATSLILHSLNAWLVLALGTWRIIGWRLAAPAAVFFAVYEGHQEAAVWYAALPELLVFTFALSSFLLWTRYLGAKADAKWLYAGSYACFLLALGSKESAVALVPFLGLACWKERLPWSRAVVVMIPFALAVAAYTAAIFAAREGHLHFNDGTFSLSAPFYSVAANSLARMFLPWGALSVVLLVALHSSSQQAIRVIRFALAWMVIAVLPYSFLTYMPRIPSRHTYLASLGLALLVSAGLEQLLRSQPRQRRLRVLTMATAAVLVQNVGYLWVKKYPQYVARAAPTEALIQFSDRVQGEITVKCFPYGEAAAMDALRIGAKRPLSTVKWDPAAPLSPSTFCDTSKP